MERPKLRKVERHALEREHERLLVLRDPFGLVEPVALAAELAPVLDLMDGKHSLAQIRQSLLLKGVLDVPLDALGQLSDDFAERGLLDDDHFRTMWVERHERFRSEPMRRPAFAGVLYPSEPTQLRAMLERAAPEPRRRIDADTCLLAAVCPHQPFDIAGSVLDPTLRGLPHPESLDVIVVLATDHQAGLTPFVVTDKVFATPIGTCESDSAFIAALERRVSWVRREEIRHANAHSVELAVVVLQHVFGASCPPIIPVLCGQTALSAGESNAGDEFVAALESLLEDRSVLWLVMAELSHTGPAYGHPSQSRAAIRKTRERDRELVDAILQGGSERFLRTALASQGQSLASGTATIHALLRCLPVDARAHLAAYQHAPVPGHVPGWVGMLGLHFFAP